MVKQNTIPRFLEPRHQEMLKAPGITDEIIHARGYESIIEESRLKRLGFQGWQIRVPGLLIPIWSIWSGTTYQYRPDIPFTTKTGKVIKYFSPPKEPLRIDVHPFVMPEIRKIKERLWITEGVKKADCLTSHGHLAISMAGVHSWRGQNGFGGKTALPDWEGIAISGREIVLAFDSDVLTKRSVYDAHVRLANFMKARGAEVRFVYLTTNEETQ